MKEFASKLFGTIVIVACGAVIGDSPLLVIVAGIAVWFVYHRLTQRRRRSNVHSV